MDIVLIEFAEPNKSWIYRCLKIKFIQRLYYSGKFQIFYPKAAVMDTLVFKPCFFKALCTIVYPSKRNVGKAMLHMAFCW